MSGLRVLLTNRALERLTGSELYLRDLARALLHAGHTPVVYTPRPGALAEELRRCAIPVGDDLAALRERPDVIHGQHLLETLAALVRWPGVPAVFVCHDASSWHDTPPRHPRVRRYLAVDEGCRERLVGQEGIAPEQCAVLPNAVDLARFRPRGALPARPRRALSFGNYVEGEALATMTRACAACGIELESLGARAGGAIRDPERVLPRYDLVLARGRCALEALAVGAAALVCGPSGVGPLVTSAELDRLRRLNFGRRAYHAPLSEAALEAQIARYDAADAALVSRRIRATANLDALVADLVDEYEAAIEAERAAPAAGPAEAEATARALHWLSLHFERAARHEARRRAPLRFWRRLGGS